MMNMEKTYSPAGIEGKQYERWEKAGYFHADEKSGKPKYSIVMPPPNITGQLHMGHALDNTLPDILIRMKRMQGFETLWLPGTDHGRPMAGRLWSSCGSWAVPAIGSGSASPWTRAAPMR